VTRRPDPLVSPDGHPEPEQRRDLIGARLCVTRHSIVRPLLLIGWKLLATAKGAHDMTMIGAERPDTEVETILGVDTHLDFHVAVDIDHLGRRLGESSVPTTVKGHERLLRWAERFGPVRCVGVEGTSSYGAGLARHLGAKGIDVLEVERPERRRRGSRRNLKKSDPSDAEAAARAVLAGESSGVPKSGDGTVEMIRALRAARRSAMKARTQAANQLQGLRVTAPEQLRQRLRGLSTKELISVAARFRLGDDPRDVPTATKFALRSVARRYEALSAEIAELEAHLDRLVAQVAPELVSLPGIGTDHAATLLMVAGDNPQRLRSEASFASLCGVSPIEASSGKIVRHRLNRGGNREANRALYMICLARMRRDRRTQEYVARRTAEGKSKREIIRCLKRYVAREVYRMLISCGARSSSTGPRDEAHIASGSSAA
jgi:transposase